jgi:hypothetical protein
MKKSTRLQSNFIGNAKTLFCCFSILLIYSATFSQIPAGPGMQWHKDQWYDMENIPQQENSGEDWHYDIKPYFEESDPKGYIACGYSTTKNEFGEFSCIDCDELTVDCTEFERVGHQRGCVYPKIAEMDLKGNIEWYKIYQKGNGWFRKVIQLQDESGYIAIGIIKFDGDNDIIYFHDEGDVIGDALTECVTDPYQLMYVIRTDNEGEIEAEAVYGFLDYDEVNSKKSEGYDIIEASDGNLVAVGYAEDDSDVKRGFVITLDIDDLHIIDRNLLYSTETYKSHSTCVIEKDELYYIVSTLDTRAVPPSYGHINVIRLDEDLDQVGTNFEINSDVEPDIDELPDTEYWTSVGYHVINNGGDLLIAAEVNRNSGDVQSINNQALVRVYRIHTGSSPGWTWGYEDPITIVDDEVAQVFRAYDLKVGIANTEDGGYVVTSTLHDTDLFEDDEEDFPYFLDCDIETPGNQPCTCDLNYDWTYVWNSDVYIAKFNASDEIQWASTYPITDGYGTYFPYDIKKLECVYTIFQADDGGFIIGGNNSKNFDDDMVMKIFNECSINTTYEGTNDIDENTDISSNTTWSSSRKVKGIITVKTGYSLTISGSSTMIEFADSKAANFPTYIVVERGAKLQIDGGAILTGNAECGTMWDGIFVYGTNGTNQPSATTLISNSYFDTGNNHGVVRIISDGTIKNARNGIFAGKKSGSIINSSYGGGIVIADDALFINNSYGIYFAPYNKTNKSLLRNCTFSTDDILLDEAENTVAHVMLLATKSINIRGCLFENTTSTTDYPDEQRGKGIYSFNSFFTADDNPDGFGSTNTGSYPNTFSELTYGIYASASEVGSNNIAVNKNIFDNNLKGYYLEDALLSETTQNTFTVRAANSAYGLYLNECTAYSVDENTFTKDEEDLYVTIGMIACNSGTEDNIVYRNTFSNLKEGSIALGGNGGSGPDHGLVFKCGDYSTSWVDIAVVDKGSTTGSVNPDQGDCLGITEEDYLTAPANNLFTDPSNVTSEGQFFTSNDVADILYVFFEDDDEDAAPFARPKEYSDAVDPYPVGAINNNGCEDAEFDIEDWATEYCPTNFSSGGGGGERISNPDYVRTILKHNNNGNVNQYREEDSLETSEFTWQDNIMLHAQLRYLIVNDMIDSIQYLLEGDNRPVAKALLAGISADSSDFFNAKNYIELLDSELAINQGYSPELLSISLDLQKDTLSWMDIDSTQRSILETLAIQDTHTGIKAQHILCFLNGTKYTELIPVIDPEQEEIARTVQQMVETKSNTIEIYPNPVKNYGIIRINLEIANEYEFMISDLTGKIIKKYNLHDGMNYIETGNEILYPGVYVCYLKGLQSGNLSKQFIVIQ